MAKRRTRERLRHYTIEFKSERRCGFEEEPDEFVTDIEGTIRFESEEKTPRKVGVIHAFVVRAERAEAREEPLMDVCDAHGSLACDFFSELFDVNTEQPKRALAKLLPDYVSGDFLVVGNVEIARQHRGIGLGLVAVERLIETFGGGCAFATLEPRPIQFDMSADDDDAWTRELKLDKFVRDEALATSALATYWSHLGFVQVPGTAKSVLPLHSERPSLEEALDDAVATGPKASATLQ